MTGGFKCIYMFSDKRTKFLNFKKFPKSWFSVAPWDIYLLTQITNINFLYTSTNNNSATTSINVTTKTQIAIHTLLNSSLTSLYMYNDASFYQLDKAGIYISSFSCLYTNNRVNIFTACQSSIYSSSYLFPGSLWVERELREFFNLNIYYLKDTRRLLTDYTVKQYDMETYKTTSYDTILQELYY